MSVLIIALIVLVLLSTGAVLLFRRYHTPNLNKVHFKQEWQNLQKHCKTRKTWPLAVIDADNLLNDALKQLHYKGKTTGERLVAAQHTLTSNETVWFGHKLRNRIANEDVRKLKKQDIVNALSGFRQALKDLGAL
jgi:hypothetical protein